MFEIVIVIILAAIAVIVLRGRKNIKPAKLYFAEESCLLDSKQLMNFKSELYLYTIAEFSEDSVVGASGLVKRLGFSDFIICYDKNRKKFMSVRFQIVAADGYDRAEKIGFYKFISTKDEWIELNVRLTPSNYNEFVADLKEAAQLRRNSSENKFFLYDLCGWQGYSINENNAVYFIDSIRRVGIYNAYYADKIGLMTNLFSSVKSDDQEQDLLMESFRQRFQDINS